MLKALRQDIMKIGSLGSVTKKKNVKEILPLEGLIHNQEPKLTDPNY